MRTLHRRPGLPIRLTRSSRRTDVLLLDVRVYVQDDTDGSSEHLVERAERKCSQACTHAREGNESLPVAIARTTDSSPVVV